MTRIIMNGCNGKMGQVISEIVAQDDNACIVAGIDVVDNKLNEYPVFTNIFDCTIEADVIIDFSTAKAIDKLFDYVLDKKIALVLCTTGLTEQQLERVNIISQEVAVLRSANMSLGINTMITLAKMATQVLAKAGYDIEIIEKHHNQKVDAPSGTALALADAINETLEEKYEYRYDRHDVREKRPKKEIGIHAVRGGTIVGEHTICFAGTDEVIELTHSAQSKAVFAKGAVEAAKFLAIKSNGLYNMSNVIEETVL